MKQVPKGFLSHIASAIRIDSSSVATHVNACIWISSLQRACGLSKIT